MIHLEAVYHRASQQFCYALNEEILMVGLQTGEEVEQVWIHYGDPFSTGILGGNEAWEGSREEIVTKCVCPSTSGGKFPCSLPINGAGISLSCRQEQNGSFILRMAFIRQRM